VGPANLSDRQRRAARLMKIGWTTWMYKKKVRRFDAVLLRRLCEMAAKHVRYGYRRLTGRVRIVALTAKMQGRVRRGQHGARTSSNFSRDYWSLTPARSRAVALQG
jgi:hypothetical protein